MAEKTITVRVYTESEYDALTYKNVKSWNVDDQNYLVIQHDLTNATSWCEYFNTAIFPPGTYRRVEVTDSKADVRK